MPPMSCTSKCRMFRTRRPAFPDDGKGVGEEVVERLAVGEARAELLRLASELFVGELLDLRLFCVDRGDERPQALQVTLVLRADDLCEERVNNHQG